MLGFFYARSVPKTASPGPCPGSNVAEMFYLLVPDPNGVVNGNNRSTAQVLTLSNGTVAHEYQHLINASRQMYVNNAADESGREMARRGLSHTAEESTSSARRVVPSREYRRERLLRSALCHGVFDVRGQQLRSLQIVSRSAGGSVAVGSDAFDDDLPTRGAIWNFLRYAADHLPLVRRTPSGRPSPTRRRRASRT